MFQDIKHNIEAMFTEKEKRIPKKRRKRYSLLDRQLQPLAAHSHSSALRFHQLLPIKDE